MKLILIISIFLSLPCLAKPYLIEDHLSFLSKRKNTKKWSIKNAISGKTSGGKKTSPLPKISVLPKNIKDNEEKEFSFGVEYGNLNLDIDNTKSTYELYRGSLSAFVRFTGLLGHFYLTEDPLENKGDLALALRLVGTSQQTTHLTLFYGISQTKEMDQGQLETINNLIWGGELVLYFTDILAGSYKLTHIEENRTDSASLLRSGRRHEIKAFIDLKYIRVFGSHILEVLDYQNTNFNKKESQGVIGGAMLFF